MFGEWGTWECEEGVPKVFKEGGTHCTSESVCRASWTHTQACTKSFGLRCRHMCVTEMFLAWSWFINFILLVLWSIGGLWTWREWEAGPEKATLWREGAEEWDRRSKRQSSTSRWGDGLRQDREDKIVDGHGQRATYLGIAAACGDSAHGCVCVHSCLPGEGSVGNTCTPGIGTSYPF